MTNNTTRFALCAHCNKEFRFYLKRPRLYCSRACYYAAHAAPMTTATCKSCGKIFEIKQSYDGRYTYCSEACRVATNQPRLCGVYMIECVVNGMVYIGSSIHIYRRWRGHRSKLNSGTHENPNLQSDYNQFGADNFKYVILGQTDKARLRDLEQTFLDKAIAGRKSYNVHPNSETPAGRKLTADQRREISRRNKGRIFSEEHRRHLSMAWSRRKLP